MKRVQWMAAALAVTVCLSTGRAIAHDHGHDHAQVDEHAQAETTTLTVDKAHTDIGFSIRHMVLSRVRGHFGEYEASLEIDDNNQLVSANATIEVASINTANEKRDDHLRADDFFDAEQFPQITFVGKHVEEVNGQKVLVGDFTIRDVTRELRLPFTLVGPVQDPWGNTKYGFQATVTINRMDYGLTWSRALETGGLVVGEEVEISLEMQFQKS